MGNGHMGKHRSVRMSSQIYQLSSAHNSRADTNGDDGAHLYKTSFNLQGQATYRWSETPRSLSDIVKDDSLPLVVKLCTENVAKGSNESSPVDLQRPLLLYKEAKGRRLHARNLRSCPAVRDVNRVIYQTTGPYITFPENFYGFFKAVESRHEPLSAVADVNRLMPTSFVSIEATDGYTCISSLHGETLYQKSSLPAGMYRPINILEDTITYVNRRKSEKKKLVRCLKCEDEKGKHVLFPMEGKGKFYISETSAKFAKHRNVDSGCRIYKWTEMDADRLKGLRVRMMHGKGPQQECNFTGLVEFRHVTKEHTLIGTTMSPSPRLFEMAVTTEPFFIVALNSKDFDSEPLQQKCLKFAKSECDGYMQAIKVRKDYDIDQAEGAE